MTTAPSFDLGQLDVIDPARYERDGYPHASWAWLRANDPVRRFEFPGMLPFRAVVRYDDIFRVSRDPEHFRNGPRLGVFPDDVQFDPNNPLLRHLINMDPPEHGRYRRMTSNRFTPRALERLRPTTEAIVAELLADLAGRDEFDFVTEFSAIVPLTVIADLLGVPRSDWKTLFQWTNEIIGAADPEYQAGRSSQETSEAAVGVMFQYFTDLVNERRKNPRDDIASTLGQATLNGAELQPFELLSYFVLLIVAGNETTRNAITGGLRAFIENPEEWRKLKANPAGMAKSAAEEIVRWVTPVIQFCRTPIEDVEMHGVKIKAGENLCLFYPSANRDESIFEDPFRFRIDRDPNPHLGFGIGEHVCLGAHLARLELQVVFTRLAERLERVEPAGEVQRLRSSFVGGIKHMPIRWKLRPSAS